MSSSASTSAICHNDYSFGPIVQGCRDDFDFTVTFERIFLSLVPSALFIFLAIGRVLFLSLRARKRVASIGLFQSFKAVCASLLEHQAF